MNPPYSKRFLEFLDGYDDEMQYRLRERHGIHVDSHCTPEQAEKRTIEEAREQMSPTGELWDSKT